MHTIQRVAIQVSAPVVGLGLVVLAMMMSTACSTSKFNGKVVSRADQKPIDAAGLKFKSGDALNNSMAGSMPAKTDKDGAFEADVAISQGSPIVVTVEKDGFDTKEQSITSGSEQTICIAPKK